MIIFLHYFDLYDYLLVTSAKSSAAQSLPEQGGDDPARNAADADARMPRRHVDNAFGHFSGVMRAGAPGA